MGDIAHEASVRLVHGVDLDDIAALRTDAIEIAEAMQPLLTAAFTIVGWRVKDATHVRVYEEFFTTGYVGVHTSTLQEWKSFSLTLTGRGVSPTVTEARGQTRFPLYTGASYPPVAGEKWIDGTADVHWAGLVSTFNLSTRYFADMFGQKAVPRALVMAQFNAHVQRVHGS